MDLSLKRLMYDEDAHLIGTYDASGHPLEEMVYLEDRPVADLRGSSTYRVFTDPLQTPRALIDASGTTVWSWDGKEAFGASAPGGSLTFNLRFPGQYADVERGLFNNGFRDYAPAWGRYVESDPIGLAGGWNTYEYVNNNPIVFFDKDGRLKTDNNGNIIFNPIAMTNPTYHVDSKISPSQLLSAPAIKGNIFTNDGTPIEAYKNTSPYKNLDYDCNGLTFTNRNYWVNNDQVDKILNGDKYKIVPPGYYQPGDVVVYRDRNGNVEHSGLLYFNTPPYMVISKGGTTPAPIIAPITPGPGGAWPVPYSTFTVYRK